MENVIKLSKRRETLERYHILDMGQNTEGNHLSNILLFKAGVLNLFIVMADVLYFVIKISNTYQSQSINGLWNC